MSKYALVDAMKALARIFGVERRAAVDERPAGTVPYWTSQEAPPAVDLAGIVLGACSLWSSVIAAASPGAAPFDASTLADLGYRLARRGKWTAVIELDRDGGVQLTPFDAWARGGVWSGITRERDGRNGRALSAPSEAVFHVELSAPPINPLSSTYELLRSLEAGLIGDARSGMAGRALIRLAPEAASYSTDQQDQLAASVEQRYTGSKNAGRVPVLPAYAVPDTMGGEVGGADRVQLREQCFAETEAQFGITGLLRPASDGASAHAHWRLAVVKTFAPIANLIEAEAERKLGEPAGLDRSAWFAAAHGDRARLIVARANAVTRLAGLEGVSVATARDMVASFDDD